MLTITYANCLADRVGPHGIDPDRLDPAAEAAASVISMTRLLANSRLVQPGKGGWEVWRQIPLAPLKDQYLHAVNDLVAKYQPRTDNLVVLGIGGSALGNIALHSALNPSTYNLLDRVKGPTGIVAQENNRGAAMTARPGPRIFVVDNVDPSYFGAVINFCLQTDPKLERTVFNVVSKSGETAETAAQFMIVRDLLKKHRGAAHNQHVVAITDERNGTMRKICDAEGYATLPVPDGVGGRFSVLSPVGLFSAAMSGIDIQSLLLGAASMDVPCSRESLLQNPAALIAFLLVELGSKKGKTNHVMMPYRNPLYLLADWYRQLWAESLGKKTDLKGADVFAGFTPIKALGTTDQHSQVQLYREGPNDKVFCFVDVAPPPIVGDDSLLDSMQIPTGLGVEAIQYLEGKRMTELLGAEKRATEYTFVESQRPNLTITFDKLDAYHVGAFIYLWEVVTAYAGLMLNINTYDQPAVELGKQATFGLMGRPGYEKHLRAVNETLAATDRFLTV
ncbi:MAG: glucose-6-phosphate isomerase [Pyrinomonadaceae bacterium]|nr:glucose-6-phosphate isomerase [Phycisphaerales bacterium]